ncbi:MAG: PLDc N-terminal domain-containing protein [Xanthomonadales bacterium]|nr:PLDc N-terminal domain-containing protein [Xanthomonadales bacterium]
MPTDPLLLQLATIATWLLWLLALVLAFEVVHERRAPAATLAWVALLLLLPVLGLLLYLLLAARKVPRPAPRPCAPDLPESVCMPTAAAPALERMLRRFGVPPATLGNALHFALTPDAARSDLLAVIDSAERELWVLVYAFFDDASGREVMTALTAAARRGVQVRLMVDDIGSLGELRTARRAFLAAGGRIVRFKPVWYALARRMANLRNHRKIVVADGARAWTGGRNIGDVYLGRGDRPWLDLSLRVDGPAAAVLAEICRSDWQFGSGDAGCGAPLPVPAATGDAVVQVLPSGPEHADDLWQAALIKACFAAQQRLWLATPYFVPDETVLNAVLTAAHSGIDVRILVPRRSDNPLVDLVARSYQREAQRAGASVHRYEPGMMHAKFVLVDQRYALFGSANIDARSLFLNYESTLVAYDAATVATLAQFFNDACARATTGLAATGRVRETLSAVARLLAPLL